MRPSPLERPPAQQPSTIAVNSHGGGLRGRGRMKHMSAPAPRYLCLPEEFLVLSHLDSGKVRDSHQTAFGCAAAELGELALRRKLLLRTRKFRKFGVEIYRLKAEIQLLDTGRTGLVWADELLAELERRSDSALKPIALGRWLIQRRRAAFRLHRNALTERGVLLRKPGRFLSSRQRHYPNRGVRNTLINQIRAAHSGQSPLDEHMLFLYDLVEGTELSKDLGLGLSWRHSLDRARDRAHGVGAEEFVPEDLRDTSAVLSGSVSIRRSGD